MMICWPASIALGLLIPLWIAAPAAAAGGDIERGGHLARQWCASCHLGAPNPAGAVPQGPPSFAAIARGGMTREQLRVFLTHPHGQMPDLALTRAEIDDLIAYIGSLR